MIPWGRKIIPFLFYLPEVSYQFYEEI